MMPWRCLIQHDWFTFRLVQEADVIFGFTVADRVCLRCGKVRLDGTEGHKRFVELAEEEKERVARRKARAAELLAGRVDL